MKLLKKIRLCLRFPWNILIAIIILSLAFQLYFVFQSPNYSSDNAYYNIRQIGYIQENLKPLFYDELSYGGRYVLDSHIFHYVLALFGLISWHALKVVPALFVSLTALLVFFLAKRLTGNNYASLFSAFVSSFMLIFIKQTLNQVSVYSLAAPIMLWAVYVFACLDAGAEQAGTYSGRGIGLFAFLMVILTLIQPLNAIIPVALLFYLGLLGLEGQKPHKITKEVVVFSILITILLNLIVFKKAFLEFGIGALWQNIPFGLLASYFREITIADAVYGIGVLPLIIGAVGLSWGLAGEKNNIALLVGAFILADVALLVLKLIPLAVGLIYLGIMLAVTCSIAFDKFLAYISITRFSKHKTAIALLLVGFVGVSIILPSVLSADDMMDKAVSKEEIEALEWIRDNTPGSSIILGDVYEGHKINFIAERKNVIDTNFIFAPDRYDDVVEIYNAESVLRAMQLLRKYKVDYIYFSDRTKERYEIDTLKYIVDENCFERQFENEGSEVYEVKC
ncbi:hypothetical protein HZB88_01225 [archaeon]|nr:hypothetical protein [archaeon]